MLTDYSSACLEAIEEGEEEKEGEAKATATQEKESNEPRSSLARPRKARGEEEEISPSKRWVLLVQSRPRANHSCVNDRNKGRATSVGLPDQRGVSILTT